MTESNPENKLLLVLAELNLLIHRSHIDGYFSGVDGTPVIELLRRKIDTTHAALEDVERYLNAVQRIKDSAKEVDKRG